MFNRLIEKSLLQWKNKNHHKPLILRGARQTGKTTIIRQFSRQFESFIELNLEKEAHRLVFEGTDNLDRIIQNIEALSGKSVIPKKTLLFIDEIQNSPQAIKMLRYFYEEKTSLHVISAGSLLEVRLHREEWSFPVGRVEFLYLYPVTFEEFMVALGEEKWLKILGDWDLKTPLSSFVHQKGIELLLDYFVVGGMPECVTFYLENRRFLDLETVHEALHTSIHEDFLKYATHTEAKYLRYLWDKIPLELGKRVRYARLGGNEYGSREISRALEILEVAMLAQKIHPTTGTRFPFLEKEKFAPKILPLDIGLSLHMLSVKRSMLNGENLDANFDGGLAESYVGQELMALQNLRREKLYFWTREEKGTTSEVDYLLIADNRVIPCEVKSGEGGTMRSLHQFLNRSPTKVGIRFSPRPFSIEKLKVTLPQGGGLDYTLVNFPLYALFRIEDFLQYFFTRQTIAS